MTSRRVSILCAFLAVWSAGSQAEQQTASGEISGTVVTMTSPAAPLARVIVTLSGDVLKPSRSMITDDRGGFVFENLPSGTFTVTARRSPYVKTTFGAKRPGRPGTPIVLAAGERVTGITVPMARGAAITGVVRQASGELAPGVPVMTTPLDGTSLEPAQSLTDDRGIYRVFGLPPGRYLVKASISDRGTTGLTQLSDAEMDDILAKLQRRKAGLVTPSTGSGAATVPTLLLNLGSRALTYGYAAIYYPGTADPDQAGAVTVGEGEERSGVDVNLQLVRTVTIDGRVSTTTGGSLPSGTQLILSRISQRSEPSRETISSPNTRVPDSTGAFQFTGVLPGRYRLIARATVLTPSSAAGAGTTGVQTTFTLSGVFWALADLAIADSDVSGISLTLQTGLHLSGRVAFDVRGRTVPSDPSSMGLRLTDASGTAAMTPYGKVAADGSFEIANIAPGRYTMMLLPADSGWSLRSVVVDGRDILDEPLEVSAGDISGALVTLTDRHTELSGMLQSATNTPASDYFVVVFSRDRVYWRPGARRVQFTRPGTDGRFVFRDLPAGDYLIAALTDMEPSDLLDPSFIERLIPAAASVHLNDGETKIQNLQLAR